MSSGFSRSLPARPDLSQQKKLAKELLRAFDTGDAEAQLRVRDVLPDKSSIALADAQFVLAREYGFANWPALKQHVEEKALQARTPDERVRDAFRRRDAAELRTLFAQYPQFREQIHAPVFGFDSPAIVAFAGDADMVDVLLDAGADPNARSSWWAGGFHPLYAATGAAAERLISAGAVVDACAAAHLDRPDLLAALLREDPQRVHERGGDGQTPLHFARSRTVVDMLLDAGAHIDARDVDHRSTPAEWMLDRARGAGRYDLSAYLVERGASTDIFLASALGLTDRVRTMLDADKYLLELRTGRGEYGEQKPSSYHIYFWTIGQSRSPLDVAAQFDHPDTLNVMLEYASPMQRFLFAARRADGAQAKALLTEHPDLVSSMGADEHRAITDAAWHGDARAVQVMMELGFDPRTPGHDAGTALHCAAWEGSTDTVAVLLSHPDARELLVIPDAHYGGTPFEWCCHGSRFGNRSHDHAGVAQLLLDAGAVPRDDHEASESVEAVIERWQRGRR